MNFNPNINKIKKLKLIICRHGQSIWNKENKFTGWTNIHLTNYGIQQTIKTTHILKNNNIIPNKIISSKLIRSIHSAEIIRNILNIPKNICTFEELNERHYGMLEGMNRNEASQKYSFSNINNIRQDFYLLPYIINNKLIIYNQKIKNIYNIHEFGESNQLVHQRLLSLWNNYIIKQLIKHEILLIISHKNTLRCLMKIIENLERCVF